MNFFISDNRFFLTISFVCGLFFHTTVFAQDEIKNFDKIKEAISKHIEGVGKFEVRSSPIKGLYLVIAPPRVFYISENAEYIIDGDITNITTGEDFTSHFRNGSRYAAVESIRDTMIIFSPPKDKIKHTITVFTDTDCYYCQKLHKEISEYNRLGIEVRYLAYPRQGPGSESYRKAITVWCSKDKKTALTKAKSGEAMKEITCKHPIDQHYSLGNLLGVHGTPALLLENGQMHPGYVPAQQLSDALDRAKAKADKK